MNAQELRIGNWFISYETDPDTTIYWQVEGIKKKGVFFRNGSSWTAEPIPIPLTPEILEQVGFAYSQKQLDKHNTACFIMIVESGKTIYMWYHDNAYHYHAGEWVTKVEYLHQLQNIVHSLTNTELQWNRNQ